MRILFHLVALLAVSPVTSAQYLNQIYDYNNSSDWGYSVFVQADGSYFMIGGGKTQQWELMAKRVDPLGIELLNKTVLKSANYSHFEGNPGAIRRNHHDDGYIVPITYQRSAFPNVFNSAGLVMLDNNGDTVWTRLHTDSFNVNRESANDCNLIPDGGYVVAIKRGDMLTPSGSILNRTDSLGNILWSAVHPSNGFYTCEYIGDGKILAGGFQTRLQFYGSNGNIYYYHSRPWFALYDTTGTLLKDTLYPYNHVGGGKIYKDKNGGFFHWGAFDSLILPNDPSNDVNFPEYVAHLDDSFRIVWIKNYADPQYKKNIWNVEQLHDSSYLLVGRNWPYGWASKLDKYGNVIWENNYTFDSSTKSCWLVDAAECPDGSIVMTGSMGANGVSHGQDVWVLVIDSMGCIIPNCAPTSVPAVKKENDVMIYPNPTAGRFTVRTSQKSKLVIRNIQGLTIAQFAIKAGSNELELPQLLSAGIYLVNVVDGNGKSTLIKLIYNQ